MQRYNRLINDTGFSLAKTDRNRDIASDENDDESGVEVRRKKEDANLTILCQYSDNWPCFLPKMKRTHTAKRALHTDRHSQASRRALVSAHRRTRSSTAHLSVRPLACRYVGQDRVVGGVVVVGGGGGRRQQKATTVSRAPSSQTARETKRGEEETAAAVCCARKCNR